MYREFHTFFAYVNYFFYLVHSVYIIMFIVHLHNYYYILHIVLLRSVGGLYVRVLISLLKKKKPIGWIITVTDSMTVGIVTMELGLTHLNYQETGLEKHVKLAQKYSFRGLWDLHPERKSAEKIVLESPIMRYILHICMV